MQNNPIIKNTVMLYAIKIISILFGFTGALSFIRASSASFDWHMNFIYPEWFYLRIPVSLMILVASMATFTYFVWNTRSTKKPKVNLPYRKIDYSLILLLCGVGVSIGYHVLRERMLTPWHIAHGLPVSDVLTMSAENFMSINFAYFQFHLLFIPILVYAVALFAYAELIARLRDKTLAKTMYWLQFFRVYPIHRPPGILMALLLISHLLLALVLLMGRATIWWQFPQFRTASFMPLLLYIIFALCALTHFAYFVMNLSKKYDEMSADKIRAEQFKSELITNVSHDIKTPLTSIINYVDLLKNEDLAGKALEYVHVLDKKSARLKILIDDLMEASKAGTGNLRVDMQEIDLAELVGQVAGEFEDSFAAKDLALVLRLPDEPVPIQSDSRHLYRTLENLFSNASKYALPGTRVFAEVVTGNEKPIFIIQNTSENPIGLSDGELTEQFIRGDKSRQTEGSGLGLCIAKSLVELMGGVLVINISGDLFKVKIGL